jgi:hypothetical protein
LPLHELSVAPADVTGSGLGLALNAPAPEPLATLRLSHPDGGELLLGVLGASHVVTVESPNSGFSEQISCTARTHGGELPDQADAPGYHLTARHDEYVEAEFRDLASQLRASCTNEPGWLGGAFPGDSAALTAIAAVADGPGWCWRTWHLYPAAGGGTVVYTESRWHP